MRYHISVNITLALINFIPKPKPQVQTKICESKAIDSPILVRVRNQNNYSVNVGQMGKIFKPQNKINKFILDIRLKIRYIVIFVLM